MVQQRLLQSSLSPYEPILSDRELSMIVCGEVSEKHSIIFLTLVAGVEFTLKQG